MCCPRGSVVLKMFSISLALVQRDVYALLWGTFLGESLWCLVTRDCNSLSVTSSFSKIKHAILLSDICVEKLCCWHFFPFPAFSSSSSHTSWIWTLFCFKSSASLVQWSLRLCAKFHLERAGDPVNFFPNSAERSWGWRSISLAGRQKAVGLQAASPCILSMQHRLHMVAQNLGLGCLSAVV